MAEREIKSEIADRLWEKIQKYSSAEDKDIKPFWLNGTDQKPCIINNKRNKDAEDGEVLSDDDGDDIKPLKPTSWSYNSSSYEREAFEPFSSSLPYKPLKKILGQPLICKFFREGKCHRKAGQCRFSHDATHSNHRPEICHSYVVNQCRKQLNCEYMHGEFPCKDHNLGTCLFGATCRFSHEPLNDFTRDIFHQALEKEKAMTMEFQSPVNRENHPPPFLNSTIMRRSNPEVSNHLHHRQQPQRFFRSAPYPLLPPRRKSIKEEPFIEPPKHLHSNFRFKHF